MHPAPALAASPSVEAAEPRPADTSPERVKTALDTVYGDRRIQRDLPPETAPPDLPKWNLRWLGPVLQVLAVLLLAGLVAGLAVLIFFVLRRIFGIRRIRDEDAGVTAQGSARKVAAEEAPVLWGREALAEADRLAQAGDFAEAIHVLLLGGLADLRRRVARALPPSLTSREILDRINLPEAARAALAAMISMVELSRFGFRPVNSSDYDRCRERFLVFAEAEEARA